SPQSDAAFNLVQAFESPACVIVKHHNPCGVATADNLQTAYDDAFACDSSSAFGGIVAFNRPLDGPDIARILERQFVEVIVAPEVSAAAAEAASAKKNVRLLETGERAGTQARLDYRRLAGGLLVQEADRPQALPTDCKVVSERRPDAQELQALDFAWRVVQGVHSNAIVLARAGATLGIGA